MALLRWRQLWYKELFVFSFLLFWNFLHVLHCILIWYHGNAASPGIIGTPKNVVPISFQYTVRSRIYLTFYHVIGFNMIFCFRCFLKLRSRIKNKYFFFYENYESIPLFYWRNIEKWGCFRRIIISVVIFHHTLFKELFAKVNKWYFVHAIINIILVKHKLPLLG